MLTPSYFANRVLDELHISSHHDLRLLEEIAWQRGALVVDAALAGAEARLSVVARRAVIRVSSATSDPRRRRFSIAHELGHLEIHRRNGGLAICTSDDIDNWQKRQASASVEQEANEFAAALLLPERFFRSRCEDCEPSLGLIADLATEFDVSLTAAGMRFTEYSPEACAIVLSRDGHIKWFRGSQEFHEMGLYVDVRSKLDPRSLAAAFFQGQPIPSQARRINYDVWIDSNKGWRGIKILEQSKAMPRYNAVLTLLRVDDVEEDW